MRPSHGLRIAWIAALLLAAGCSSSNKGKIEGTKWSSQATTLKGQAVSAGLMQLHFQPDGKMILKRGNESYTGTYSLGMGPTVTFQFEQEFNGRKIHAEKIVINGDELTLTDSDGKELPFRKLKEPQ
jgi:hypothetical protein